MSRSWDEVLFPVSTANATESNAQRAKREDKKLYLISVVRIGAPQAFLSSLDMNAEWLSYSTNWSPVERTAPVVERAASVMAPRRLFLIQRVSLAANAALVYETHSGGRFWEIATTQACQSAAGDRSPK